MKYGQNQDNAVSPNSEEKSIGISPKERTMHRSPNPWEPQRHNAYSFERQIELFYERLLVTDALVLRQYPSKR